MASRLAQALSVEPDYLEWVELELPVDEGTPRKARREVRDATAGKLSPCDSEVAVLLASELVTNAVVHPEHREKDSIGLQISADRGRVRVEVADSGAGFDPTALRSDSAVGGRGLLIVDREAVCWGTSRDDRFRVWFELSPASPAAVESADSRLRSAPARRHGSRAELILYATERGPIERGPIDR
jgi:anti-sigma regulatory factor (Ser/Thr protein kinase)